MIRKVSWEFAVPVVFLVIVLILSFFQSSDSGSGKFLNAMLPLLPLLGVVFVYMAFQTPVKRFLLVIGVFSFILCAIVFLLLWGRYDGFTRLHFLGVWYVMRVFWAVAIPAPILVVFFRRIVIDQRN